MPYRLRHQRIDGLRVCLDCNAPMESAEGRRKRRVPLRCVQCKAKWDEQRDVPGQRAAHKAVKAAIKNGTLRPPSERLCADCGKRAHCYDHRDYSRALDVDPVCIACNWKRGHGAPATGGLFTRLLAAHLQGA